MNLVFDIGNTNIKTGVFENGKLMSSWRMAADPQKTADEYGIQICAFFDYIQCKTSDVRGIMISSVMPSINYTIEHTCQEYFKKTPLFVGPGIKTGINLRYDNQRELGADRICNAVAAYKLYGGPCITVDFGTATTFGVVAEKGDFIGGAICPGIKISIDALVERTSMLTKVELVKPPRAIATNSAQGIQSGIFYGFVGQVDYIIDKLCEELKAEAQVIATGGMANLLVGALRTKMQINPTLTLQGLNMLYETNRGE